MKSAREMFKRLRYKEKNWLDNIIFTKETKKCTYEIYFSLDYNSIRAREICGVELKAMNISMPVLKAIIKQCEELGWLE